MPERVGMEEGEIRKMVGIFLKKRPPPAKWSNRLKKILPTSGAVAEFILLVMLKNQKKGKIVLEFIVVASDICTRAACKAHCVDAPDGAHVTWGSLAPKFLHTHLLEKLTKLIVREGRKKVPLGWKIQYVISENVSAGSAK